MAAKTKKRSYSKRRVARNARSKQSFFMLKKDDLKVMSMDAALVISLLADLEWRANSRKNSSGKEKCWIFCTIPYMEKEIHLLRFRQDKAIIELTDKKFLKIQRRGSPPRRYFFVDWEKIEEAIQKKYPTAYDDNEDDFKVEDDDGIDWFPDS